MPTIYAWLPDESAHESLHGDCGIDVTVHGENVMIEVRQQNGLHISSSTTRQHLKEALGL